MLKIKLIEITLELEIINPSIQNVISSNPMAAVLGQGFSVGSLNQSRQGNLCYVYPRTF